LRFILPSAELKKSLIDLKEFDFKETEPVLKFSTEEDEDLRKQENSSFRIWFEAEFKQYLEKMRTYESSRAQAYAYLWLHCTKEMKDEIRSRNDFITKVRDNPIELLKAIKEHALGIGKDRPGVAVIADALTAVLTTKQETNECVWNYTARFRSALNLMKEVNRGMPIVPNHIVAASPGDNPDDLENVRDVRENHFNQLMAYCFIKNARDDKYGSLLRYLKNEYTRGNNRYPLTIADASAVLSRWDGRHEETDLSKS
jgi:hypothetical protein